MRCRYVASVAPGGVELMIAVVVVAWWLCYDSNTGNATVLANVDASFQTVFTRRARIRCSGRACVRK